MTRTTLFTIGLLSVFALGQAGCGDSGSVNPRGGLHIFVGAPSQAETPANMVCNGIYFSQEYYPNSNDAPSAVSTGVAIANGDSGYEVQCRVAPSGDGYSVDLRLRDDDIRFTLRGDVNAAGVGENLIGTVSRFGWGQDALSTTSINGVPCTLTVKSEGGYYIDRGTLYGEFLCPVATNAPSSACRLSGHVFFERCSG